ncbi:MAG: hypothetical protein CME88_00710 [Hirschia sp.]|nr:hypothetical protein [Hirschia sp.]MBF16881.1 hypothetical protein [Hirschia sp.]
MAQMVCPETGMKFTISNVVAHANTFEFRRRIPADIQAHYNGKKWISRTMGRLGNMHAIMIAAEQLDGFYDAEFDAHCNVDAQRVADKPDARHLAFSETRFQAKSRTSISSRQISRSSRDHM